MPEPTKEQIEAMKKGFKSNHPCRVQIKYKGRVLEQWEYKK